MTDLFNLGALHVTRDMTLQINIRSLSLSAQNFYVTQYYVPFKFFSGKFKVFFKQKSLKITLLEVKNFSPQKDKD